MTALEGITRLKMSQNTTGTSTMNKSSTPAKRVSKKSDVPAVASVPAPVASATPAVPVVEKATKKSKPAVAPSASASAAPVAAAPVVSAVADAAVAVEAKTVEQEIAALVASHQKILDEAVTNIKTLQRLQKRVAKEVKEAGRRRRRVCGWYHQ